MNPLTRSADGLQLLDGGQPFMQRGTLDWPLFGRYLNEGEAVVRAVMADRRSVGANTIALAGMLSWGSPDLHPSNPAYWSSLIPFTRIAADEGMRLQWVVLCDTRPFDSWWRGLPELPAQQAHWERFLVTLAAEPNSTFIVANQPDHPSQTIRQTDTTTFVKPASFPGLLCARNNPYEDANPVLPAMDFSCWCAPRKLSKYGTFGSSMWYVVNGWPEEPWKWGGTHQASLLFEPPRIETTNEWANPGLWREMGRQLSAKGCIGGNIYSRHGIDASILAGVTRDCYVEYLGNIPSA